MKVRVRFTMPACVVVDVPDDDPDTLYDALSDVGREEISLDWESKDIFDFAPLDDGDDDRDPRWIPLRGIPQTPSPS